ncbi:MAG TPA: TIGR02611 family protein [Micromonosporaceae bacterium]|jgi:uncharacterized protein (TIGR02611 family)|nr:TIGR02611 family protein [Micromonosporaceae bacterium]
MAERPARAEDSQVKGSDSPDHENPPDEPSLGRVDRFLQRRRRTAAGRLTVRIVITVLGLAVIALGIILLPLPGPGWVIIFGGLALWSLEYAWAARLRRFAIREVMRWTRWVARQPWWARLLIATGLLVLVVAIIAGSLLVSFGPEIIDKVR